MWITQSWTCPNCFFEAISSIKENTGGRIGRWNVQWVTVVGEQVLQAIVVQIHLRGLDHKQWVVLGVDRARCTEYGLR